MATSSGEVWFRKVCKQQSNAFALVDALITEKAEENEWREFKEAVSPPSEEEGKASAKRQELENKVKEYWSENLSAFGNSGGGILIWGIKAPSRAAEKQSLARDAVAFADRLVELLRDAVEPPIPGVEVLPVVKPKSTEGFVVCFIPNSDYSPHRAIWAKRDYYIRAADNNVPMRTEVLRRMFYPHTSARLAPLLLLSIITGDDRRIYISITVEIENRGSASAKETYIEVSCKADRGVFTAHPDRAWQKRGLSANPGFVCNNTIHPREKTPFLQNVTNVGGYGFIEDLPATLVCEFRIFAENSLPLVAVASFHAAELKTAFIRPEPINREATISVIP